MKYLSFFSGALGLDLGIESVGFEPALYCEFDKDCQKTIRKNKPDTPLIDNIENYSADEIIQIASLKTPPTLIVGGPPCQAFSTAGARRSFEDSRGNVFTKFLEIATQLAPSYIVIENVRGLLSARFSPSDDKVSEKGSALKYIVFFLENAGYGVSFNLYNAANFGTPQSRERLILVASKNGEKLPYLMPTHSESGAYDLPKWRTFRDAVAGLTPPKSGEYFEIPSRRREFYKLLKEGENWRNLPVELQEKALGKAYFLGGGKTGFFRRLAWDKPSPTLVTTPIMPATDLIHPEELRALSVKEYARIQEFPDSWQFEGTLTSIYKQIGNAVPLGLSKAVGKLILSHLQGKLESPPEDFKYSRYQKTSDRDLIPMFTQISVPFL